MLNQCLLEPKHVLLREGQPVSLAYFIMSGSLLAKRQNNVFRLGAGAVVGLAEAIAGTTASFDVIAVSTVSARIFPIQKVATILPSIPGPIAKIVQTLARRSVELPRFG